jgi:hypothetical protein
MTTARSTTRRPRLSTRTVSVRLIAASFAAAAAISGGLAVQMANGHDPALGSGTSSAQTSGSSGSSAQSGAGGFGSSASGQSSFQDQSGSQAGGVVTRAS